MNAPALADDAKIIYIASFVPIMIMFCLDFISDKWKTIRETRRNGTIQLVVSLPSLFYVLYYITVQVASGDHKEAAAAIVIAALNIYFVLRALWGLIQLYEFRNWDVQALICLIKLGYSAPCCPPADWLSRVRPNSNFIDDVLDSSNLTLANVIRTVDHFMIVNSSLIDNELTNTVLPMHPVLPNRLQYGAVERHSVIARMVSSFLKCAKPEECSVRWLASFLAMFGSKWLFDARSLYEFNEGNTFNARRWRASRDLAVLATFHSTTGEVTPTGSTEKFETLFSPFHKFCITPRSCYESIIHAVDANSLPFNMRGYPEKTFDFCTQDATMKKAVLDDWPLIFQNKLSDNHRAAVQNISPVHLACFSQLMRQENRFGTNWDIFLGPGHWMSNCGIDNIIYQLGNDGEKDGFEFVRELPYQKAIWIESGQNGLLQPSFHIDNWISLENGDNLYAFKEGFGNMVEQEAEKNVFQQQYDLEIARLEWDVVSDRQRQTGRFLGCVIETVRSTLAKWVANSQSDASGWIANVSTDPMSFVCSKQLCSSFEGIKNAAFMASWRVRLIWEVQSFLRWKIGEEAGSDEKDLRTSQAMIMLFILGFPSVRLEHCEEESHSAIGDDGHTAICFEKKFTMIPVQSIGKNNCYCNYLNYCSNNLFLSLAYLLYLLRSSWLRQL